MAKEYIAKESTSQAILTKATETDTAVDGIVGKVGETNDSSGSATSGGIFAKLNKVITDTTSLLTRLTTARAASLDRIGSNGDSGNDTLFGVLSQGTNIEPDVKEFLNSTVGTSSFKPLNEMVTNYSPIKSIQSGYVDRNTMVTMSDTTNYGSNRYLDVNINSINNSKAILLLNGGGTLFIYDTPPSESRKRVDYYRARGRILNNNTIRLYHTRYVSRRESYYIDDVFWTVIEFK